VTKRLLLLVLLAFGVACQKSPAAQPPPTSAKPATATQAATQAQGQVPAPQVKPVPEQLPVAIARVNGEAIGKDEFERAVKNLEARAGQPVPAEKRSEVYRGLLDQMIAYKLLLQESKTLKVTIPESDIDSRIKQIQGNFPSEQEFAKALSDQHVTLQQLKNDQREQLLVAKVIDTQVSWKVNVTPKDADDFYAKNPDQFKEPENVHVQHILIRTPPPADAPAKAKAKTEAEAIRKQIRGGADFAKLAREKSQDPGSAPNGGDLPAFARAKDAPNQAMVPQFEEAAFKLKPGQVSPVVETQFGFHIIKMVEHRPARTVPLEEARPQITEVLKEQQANQKTAAYIDQLKAKSRIEIYI
jgi:peptidyl-prolyl cis-trans isomerase C